jgi:hypothetical protein
MQDRAVWGAAAHAQSAHAAANGGAAQALSYSFFRTGMWGSSQAGSLPPGVLVLSVRVRQLLAAQDVQNTGAAPSANKLE